MLVPAWALYPFQNSLSHHFHVSCSVYFSRGHPIIEIPAFSAILKFWNVFIALGLHLIFSGFYTVLKWKLLYSGRIYLLRHLVFSLTLSPVDKSATFPFLQSTRWEKTVIFFLSMLAPLRNQLFVSSLEQCLQSITSGRRSWQGTSIASLCGAAQSQCCSFSS